MRMLTTSPVGRCRFRPAGQQGLGEHRQDTDLDIGEAGRLHELAIGRRGDDKTVGDGQPGLDQRGQGNVAVYDLLVFPDRPDVIWAATSTTSAAGSVTINALGSRSSFRASVTAAVVFPKMWKRWATWRWSTASIRRCCAP